MLDGPGALGGAISLVTSKPTEALEGELQGTFNLSRGADYEVLDGVVVGAGVRNAFDDNYTLTDGSPNRAGASSSVRDRGSEREAIGGGAHFMRLCPLTRLRGS